MLNANDFTVDAKIERAAYRWCLTHGLKRESGYDELETYPTRQEARDHSAGRKVVDLEQHGWTDCGASRSFRS